MTIKTVVVPTDLTVKMSKTIQAMRLAETGDQSMLEGYRMIVKAAALDHPQPKLTIQKRTTDGDYEVLLVHYDGEQEFNWMTLNKFPNVVAQDNYVRMLLLMLPGTEVEVI